MRVSCANLLHYRCNYCCPLFTGAGLPPWLGCWSPAAGTDWLTVEVLPPKIAAGRLISNVPPFTDSGPSVEDLAWFFHWPSCGLVLDHLRAPLSTWLRPPKPHKPPARRELVVSTGKSVPYSPPCTWTDLSGIALQDFTGLTGLNFHCASCTPGPS